MSEGAITVSLRDLALFVFCSLVALTAKIYLASRGHNFDIESYTIVSDIVLKGGNVYCETDRYNYAPIWSWILGALRWIQMHWLFTKGPEGFHLLLAGMLSLVDIGIGVLAWRCFGFSVSILFLLNPISVLITGYHTQFDNFSVLLAFSAACVLNSADTRGKLTRGLFLLGLSLVIKHVFIFFPFWLCIKYLEERKDRLKPLLALVVPLGIFLLSFAFYIGDEKARVGIIDNVFRYNSFMKQSLFTYLLGIFFPIQNVSLAPIKVLWAVVLVVLGFTLRKNDVQRMLLFYSVAMVLTSPAITDQYLAIPVLAACVLFSWQINVMFFAISAVYLSISSYNWHPAVMASYFHKDFQAWHCLAPLFVAFVYELFSGHKEGSWSIHGMKDFAKLTLAEFGNRK